MFKWLEGKKRYLGILVFGTAKALENAGKLGPGAAELIQIVGGTVFGIGYVDAEKRKTQALKEVARS